MPAIAAKGASDGAVTVAEPLRSPRVFARPWQRYERVRDGKRHRPHRIVEANVGAKIDRRRFEQRRLRPGYPQALPHRVEAYGALIALEIGADASQLPVAGLELVDTQLAGRVGPGERPVDVRLQR